MLCSFSCELWKKVFPNASLLVLHDDDMVMEVNIWKKKEKKKEQDLIVNLRIESEIIQEIQVK